MSTIKVTNIEHASTANGGIQLDNAGHVTVDGQQMPTAGALSNRNLIINGAMQVSQRATSKTGLTGSINDYYTVDRFRFENFNDASQNSSVWTMEQVSLDAPEGFSYSLRCTATTADSDYGSGASQTNIHTRLEGQDLQLLKYGTPNAEKLTLSFWVKSSVPGTYLAWFYQIDDNRHCTKKYTINSANTWEHKTVTINGDTTGVIDKDNTQGLTVRWLLGTGSTFQGGTYLDGNWAAFTNADTYEGQTANVASTVNNIFAITGVQLEIGEKATPFEHRSYGDELEKCRRYYQKFLASSAYTLYGVGSAYDANRIRLRIPFTTEMRVPPSALEVSGVGDFLLERDAAQAMVSSSIVLAGVQTTSASVEIDSATNFSTGGVAYNVYSNNNSSAYMAFTAEL